VEKQDAVDPCRGRMITNPAAVLAFFRECLRHFEETERRGGIEGGAECTRIERGARRLRLTSLLVEPVLAHRRAKFFGTAGAKRTHLRRVRVAEVSFSRRIAGCGSRQPHRFVIANQRDHAAAGLRRVAFETTEEVHRLSRVRTAIEDITGLHEDRGSTRPSIAAIDELRGPQDSHEAVVRPVDVANGDNPPDVLDGTKIEVGLSRGGCDNEGNGQDEREDETQGCFILSRIPPHPLRKGSAGRPYNGPVRTYPALTPELETFRQQFEQLADEGDALVASLDDAQFNWSPAAGRWSIAQCFEHLNVTARVYLPKLDEGIAEAIRRGLYGEGPFKYNWFGRMFVRSQEPTTKMKYKAAKVFQPSPSRPKQETLAAFRAYQVQFVDRLRQANGLDLARARVKSPAINLLRMPLGSGFALMVAHERRHLQQARTVLADPGFPR
jgi:hypothetical protein